MGKGQRFYKRDKYGKFAEDDSRRGLPGVGAARLPYDQSPMYGIAASDVDDASDRLYAAVRNEHIKEGDWYWMTPEGDISGRTLNRILRTQLERDRYVAWINGTDDDRNELAEHWGDQRFAADKLEEINMRGHVVDMEYTDQWNDQIAKQQAKHDTLTKGPKDADVTPDYLRRMQDFSERFDVFHQCIETTRKDLTTRDLAWTIRHCPQTIDKIAVDRNAHKLSKRDSDWVLQHLDNPDKNRRLAIIRLNLSDDMKDRILHSDDPSDRSGLALRSDLTLEQKQALFDDKDEYVRENSVRWMDKERFQEAASDPSPRVRAEVARNDFATKQILSQLSDDPDPNVRWAVTFNDNASTETIDKLAGDKETTVAETAVINKNVSEEKLQKILDTETRKSVREHAAVALEAKQQHTDYWTVLSQGRDAWAHRLNRN